MKITIKKIIKTIVAMVFLCNFTFAQKVITGKVIDSNSEEPLIGVNIQVTGTTKGTTTNLEGVFSIEVGNATSLTVSITGYAIQAVDISSGSNFIIRMFSDSQTFEEKLTIRKLAILSASLEKFIPPIQLNFGPRKVGYAEALVLKISVDERQLNDFPPNIEPFLYIGSKSYQIFQNNPIANNQMELVFHIKDWENLKDASPILLTVVHEGPVYEPKKFFIGKEVIFRKSIIKDNR